MARKGKATRYHEDVHMKTKEYENIIDAVNSQQRDDIRYDGDFSKFIEYLGSMGLEGNIGYYLNCGIIKFSDMKGYRAYFNRRPKYPLIQFRCKFMNDHMDFDKIRRYEHRMRSMEMKPIWVRKIHDVTNLSSEWQYNILDTNRFYNRAYDYEGYELNELDCVKDIMEHNLKQIQFINRASKDIEIQGMMKELHDSQKTIDDLVRKINTLNSRIRESYKKILTIESQF